jgi:hypothetical protein
VTDVKRFPDIFFLLFVALKAKGERDGWVFQSGVRRLIREAGKDEAVAAEQGWQVG